MLIQGHTIGDKQFAEIKSEELILRNVEEGMNLMADFYYQGFDGIILHEKNITSEFFELKSGLAGEVLQKFSNYKMFLAVVGEFDKYGSNSLRDFIRESNKAGRTVFVGSVEGALKRLGS